jgi:hypothetical protein
MCPMVSFVPFSTTTAQRSKRSRVFHSAILIITPSLRQCSGLPSIWESMECPAEPVPANVRQDARQTDMRGACNANGASCAAAGCAVENKGETAGGESPLCPVMFFGKWWPETGLNRRRRPFQGRALPLSYLASVQTSSCNFLRGFRRCRRRMGGSTNSALQQLCQYINSHLPRQTLPCAACLTGPPWAVRLPDRIAHTDQLPVAALFSRRQSTRGRFVAGQTLGKHFRRRPAAGRHPLPPFATRPILLYTGNQS